MKNRQFVASIIAIIYFGAMSPAFMYSEDSSLPAVTFMRPIVPPSAASDKSTCLVKAIEGGVITVGTTEIEIPADALEKDTEISITRLPATHETGDDLMNVTTGGGGWRFEPAGTQFRKSVTIKMGYDPNLNKNKAALDNLYTYFYNEKEKKWERLERVGFEPEISRIISKTTHFTDMINATITMPEGPSPLNFNINSIKNLEAANPSSGVAKIEGLEANNTGTASFRLALDVPAGRAGMQPAVALTYSSDGGSGLCGKGFDVSAGSSITTDTRWGLPTYTKNDTYLLDGVKLVQYSGSDDSTVYNCARETAYQKIVHVHNSTSNYWVVTEKSGRIKVYGANSDNWNGVDSTQKFSWHIGIESDPWGNTVKYAYERKENYVYLKEICYTGNGNDKGPYTVEFGYIEDRPDVRVDARGKFISKLTRLLSTITMKYGEEEIRTYELEYETDDNSWEVELGMSLLKRFSQTKTDDNVKVFFYSYAFNYEEPAKSGNSYAFFSDNDTWDLPYGVQVQDGVSSGSNGSLSAGLGAPQKVIDVRVSGGLTMASNSGETMTSQTLVDINGDGLPDSVRKSGSTLYVAFNDGAGRFDDKKDYNGIAIGGLDKEKNGSTSTGFNVYGGIGFKAGIPQLGFTYARTKQRGWTEQITGFADVDGDGLTDILQSGLPQYYRNNGNGFDKKTLVVSSGDSITDSEITLDDNLKKEYDNTFLRQSPLRAWRAPCAGEIHLEETVDPIYSELSADGLIANTFKGSSTAPDLSMQRVFTSSETGVKHADTNYNMAADEHLYFLVDTLVDTRNDSVAWNAKIDYSEIQPFADMNREIQYWPWMEYDRELPDDRLDGLYNTETRSQGEGSLISYYTHYSRRDDWKTRIDGNIRSYLIEDGRFVPGRLEPDDFKFLIKKVNDDDEIPDSFISYLFAYYQYDGGRNEYRVNPLLLGNSSLLNAISLIIEKCTPQEKNGLLDYKFRTPENSIIPSYSGDNAYWTTVDAVAKSWSRARENPGYVYVKDSSQFLVVDTVESELWTLKQNTETNGTIYKNGTEYHEASIANQTKDGVPSGKTITIRYEENDSVVYDQIYAFSNYIPIATELTKDELDKIRIAYQGDSYSPDNAFWAELSYGDYVPVRDICDATELESLALIYRRVPPASATDPSVPVPDSECTYVLESLNQTLREDFQSILTKLAWSRFFAYPCVFYEQVGETDHYMVKSEYLDVINTKASERTEDEQDAYDELLQFNKAYHLERWGSCSLSVVYYANGMYTVRNGGGMIRILNLDPLNGFSFVMHPIKTAWDSGLEYSALNNVVSPVSYNFYEKDDTDTLVQSTNKIECREILSGGVQNWYYGFWYGRQESDGNPFSEQRMKERRTDVVAVTKEEMKSRSSAFEKDCDDGKVTSYDPDVRYNAATRNAINSDEYDDIDEDLKVDGSRFIENETDTARSMDETYLIGTVSTQLKSELTDKEDGSVDCINHSYQYCPYIKGDEMHPNRLGGCAYYEIKGILPVASNGGSGRPFEMVKIRKGSSHGTDINKTGPSIKQLTSFSTVFSDFKSNAKSAFTSKVTDAIDAGTIPGVGSNRGTNSSESEIYQAVQDINGDGIADILKASSSAITVVPGSRSGFDTSYSLSNAGLLSENSSECDVWGATISSGSGSVVTAMSGAKPKGHWLSGSGGGTYARAKNSQSSGLADVNGDGLPDYVTGGSVNINQGNRFVGVAESNLGFSGISLNEGQMFTYGLSASLGRSQNQSSAANSSNTKTSFGVAGGLNYSVSRTETNSMLLDINGDGLPDKVSKSASSGTFEAYLNRGNCFSAKPIYVAANQWSFSLEDKSKITFMSDGSIIANSLKGIPIIGSAISKTGVMREFEAKGVIVNPFGFGADINTNVLDMSVCANLGSSGSLNGNITISIPIPTLAGVYYINITVGAGGGVNSGASLNGVSVRMMDINGDGLADRVMRIPASDRMYVQLNTTGKIGLLTKIDLPQGGSYELGYKHTSELYRGLNVGNTQEMPQARNVLVEVIKRDGCGSNGIPSLNAGAHEYSTKYEYRNGYYDRKHKEFFGYQFVSTYYGTDSPEKVPVHGHKTVEYFNGYKNTDREDYYYCKGMVAGVSTYSKDGALLREQRYSIDVSPYARVTTETNTIYETGGSLKTEMEYGYDGFGNVNMVYDRGDTSTSADDLTATITYKNSNNPYFHNHPESITVVDSNNKTLRYRKAEYDYTYGCMTGLTQYDGKKYSTSVIGWDNDYGNISSITDPNGAKVSYVYDAINHQYVTGIASSGQDVGLGVYESSMDWDPVFGVKTLERDENDNVMRYSYDAFGRLETVTSPKSTEDNPSVRYSYNVEPNKPWSAVTENKITFDPDDDAKMVTVISVDGLGRAAFTAKQGETRDGNNVQIPGWNVSGPVAYDDKGRTVQEGQNFFVAGGLQSILDIEVGELVRPTVRTYDELDRVKKLTLPDGATQETGYRIDAGVAYARTDDLHGGTNDSHGVNSGVRAYTERGSDAKGNVLSVSRYSVAEGKYLARSRYTYNAMGEMLEAHELSGGTDNTIVAVEYDLLGRKTALDSMDAGRKEYEYDIAGNLIRETDNLLRGRGDSIRYEYDGLNRLVTIDYPKSVDTKHTYGEPNAANNGAGRIVKTEDESGTIEYEYGSLGEMVTERRTIKRLALGGTTEETNTMRYVSDYLGRMQTIEFPDGEIVKYGYDYGGQIKTVAGTRQNTVFSYVKDIAYDEYGQRKYIEYGQGVDSEGSNKGVRTWYTYDENRRWLKTLRTAYVNGSDSVDYQKISYTFDVVGNVNKYKNAANTYETTQDYFYDDMHQLVEAKGLNDYWPGGRGSYQYYAAGYTQKFSFDDAGNMTRKISSANVRPKYVIGSDLNYDFDYEYYKGYAHRLERAGKMYYQYDANGNLLIERYGCHAPVNANNAVVTNEGSLYSTDYGFGLANDASAGAKKVYQRTYSWNERNLMTSSDDGSLLVKYRYGADGQRALKSSSSSETLYFNSMWTVKTDPVGLRQSKNIYVGESRIVTKCNYQTDNDPDSENGGSGNLSYESKNIYWYHSDHLGSAQFVTDTEGKEHECLEYTPYGELWIERTTTGVEKLPYRFTGKEFDEETGLYYYGARYLDPKYSRWLSADPALGEYIPGAPVNEEARKRNGNLPGMGGVFNTVNFALYHYAGNNPVKYLDPDGRTGSFPDGSPEQDKQWEKAQYDRTEGFDIRNIQSSSHDEVQKQMPEGKDAIWVLGTELSASAMGSFGTGFAAGLGAMKVTFTNCRTNESFDASFLTGLDNDNVAGIVLTAGGGVTQYGGMGVVPSGSSPEQIVKSFERNQGITTTGSLFFLSGGHSSSKDWKINSFGFSGGVGLNFGAYMTNGGIKNTSISPIRKSPW